jgi:sn-glycerol 3-phosphate transport system permease protein
VQRRVIFNGTALPLLFLAPQLAVTAVFFLWPAGVAVYQSVLQQDAWGLRTEFVGLRNFAEVFADPDWRAAAWNTALFSAAVAGLAMGAALVLGCRRTSPSAAPAPTARC